MLQLLNKEKELKTMKESEIGTTYCCYYYYCCYCCCCCYYYYCCYCSTKENVIGKNSGIGID